MAQPALPDYRSDEEHLARLGYRQELGRTLGAFTTFATGFAFISILTGAFQLFGFAFSSAGPSFWWTWLIALGGQALFALCFAELSVHYPLAGSVYNWAKRVGRPTTAWMAGFSLTLALIVSTAAVGLAMQFVLPTISDVFWLYGDGSGQYDAATNGAILGTVAIALTTIVNLLGPKVVAVINNIGVVVELVASAFLIIFFFVAAKRGPQIVLHTDGHAAGNSLGTPGALMVAILLGVYILWGFDTAGSLGEETINPRKNSPRAILRAIFAAGLTGALLMIGALMAAKNIHDPQLSVSGLPYIVDSVLGHTLGRIALTAVTVAIFVCVLANQTGAMRMLFAMSRDNALPASAALARVSRVTKAPVLASIITGVIAIVILLVNIRQPQIFTVVTSTTVILAVIAYTLVAGAFVGRRLRGQWTEDTRYFHLGRWGLPVGIAAVVWGVLVVVNTAWPRKAVYNPAPPFHWAIQWGAVLFVGIVLLLGLGYYRLVQRHKVGVLAQHAAVADQSDPAPANLAAVIDAPLTASPSDRPADPSAAV
ncbi:amino acid permease [Planosporangium thailandense]|uniref:Amino acid permease n=1 Tax=Planosporangium thailandense TaxID=765197 RepID=A0ABX0Y6S9_9ACTN|nr:APC family permease [Planosporangium thailandense]NJC73255.1 amino acid permease [Planosporangium thailandense]